LGLFCKRVALIRFRNLRRAQLASYAVATLGGEGIALVRCA
jgi:hypothetical protein